MKLIRENSSFRIAWDGFIAFLILITFLLLPLTIAFQPESLVQKQKYFYLLDCFFCIDIFLNFYTNYYHHGEEVTIISKIKKNYLRSFFALDVVANLPLLMIPFVGPSLFIYSVPLSLLLRVVNLLRVMRLFLIFYRWENYSHTNPGYIRIFKLFVTVIVLTHWIACLWFFLAYIDDFPANSWVVSLEIEKAPVIRQYIYSLYWAVTTMTTIGYGDITPNRDVEYIVTTVIMIVGASTYAFIIGNIASLFSNLDAAQIAHKNKVEALSKFLVYHNVPSTLVVKLRNYYDYIWERHRGLPENDLLADLPLYFQLDILQCLAGDLLEKIALFKYCSPALRNILLVALKFQTYPPSSYIVREGDRPEGIYFISGGEVNVFSEKESSFQCTLEAGEYFGHLSLIFNERLTASVQTLTYCEIFILSKEQFNYIKNEYSEFKEVLNKAAAENTQKMSQLILEGLII